MEIKITAIVNSISPINYSASAAELGLNAGETTWGNATKDANELLAGDAFDREAYISFFKDFGAWSVEELNNMTDCDIKAMMLQYIAGDMREGDITSNMTADEWAEYESSENAGRIFLGVDGEIYFYIGS